jgi:hypothetical protein
MCREGAVLRTPEGGLGVPGCGNLAGTGCVGFMTNPEAGVLPIPEDEMSLVQHPRAQSRASALGLLACVIGALALSGCDDSTPSSIVETNFGDLTCSIPENEMASGGVPPDGIPALNDPEFVAADDSSVDYLLGTDRVIGILHEGRAWAVPHNVGWWHEIVNMDLQGGPQIAATYCPLTGSSLVFDREVVGGATLGVSGILFQNNLVMFDRNEPSSLWFQMHREARCGPADGTPFPMVAAFDIRWGAWKDLHPETLVVTGDLGRGRDYTLYPYGNYEQSQELLIPMPGIDDSRFRKERVLGVPEDDNAGGVLFPFGILRQAAPGPVAVAETQARGGNVVVFWDQNADAAMAFRPRINGSDLSFRVDDDRILDRETESVWRLDGLAVSGELEGERLQPIAEAYTAFWFAWRAFHPESVVWELPGGS